MKSNVIPNLLYHYEEQCQARYQSNEKQERDDIQQMKLKVQASPYEYFFPISLHDIIHYFSIILACAILNFELQIGISEPCLQPCLAHNQTLVGSFFKTKVGKYFVNKVFRQFITYQHSENCWLLHKYCDDEWNLQDLDF